MSPMAPWQREIANFAGIKSLFVIEGNVSDRYAFAEPDRSLSFPTLKELLPRLLGSADGTRSYRFLFCDPLRGITDPLGDGSAANLARAAAEQASRIEEESAALNFSAKQQPYADDRLVHDAMLVRAALTRRLDPPAPRRRAQDDGAEDGGEGTRPFSVACVYDFASQIAASPASPSPEESAVFLSLFLAARDAIRGDGVNVNTLVLVVNAPADLPAWLVRGNPCARTVTVPNPSRDDRLAFFAAALPDLSAEHLAKTRDKLVDVTDGMKIEELDELRRLYARGETPPERIVELVDIYKYGIRENRWTTVAGKLRGDAAAALRRRVKGQDRAIEKIVAVLKRSVMGFSGMQHSSNAKPKGVLFLAGPTGTGKTEMVKAVTELLFGDERSCLRFDMSEYAAENSDQKLFGAPPGYVGYEAGGQLTNAVRANPFSVLLFDEIEKAHPTIMDKFLQILEDGRMTDGQGATVYFSETLIFFTSNVGISEEVLDEHGRVRERRSIVRPGEPYDQIEQKVERAMAAHFKPEVLNRIGDNIVVFDYISPEASSLILRSQIERINANVKARCGAEVAADEACMALLEERALSEGVREKGGRGIGNLVESAYLNPLAQFMFDEDVRAGDAVRATADDGAVRFVAERRGA